MRFLTSCLDAAGGCAQTFWIGAPRRRAIFPAPSHQSQRRSQKERGKNLHAHKPLDTSQRVECFSCCLTFIETRSSLAAQEKERMRTWHRRAAFLFLPSSPGAINHARAVWSLFDATNNRSLAFLLDYVLLSAVNAHHSSTFCLIELALNLAVSCKLLQLVPLG